MRDQCDPGVGNLIPRLDPATVMSPGINTAGNIPEQIAEENYIVNALRTGRKHVLDIYPSGSRRARLIVAACGEHEIAINIIHIWSDVIWKYSSNHTSVEK